MRVLPPGFLADRLTCGDGAPERQPVRKDYGSSPV
jgi:hypothetical protein